MRLQKNTKVVTAMVRRHIEDAAFYWSQYDVSEQSTKLRLVDLIRFSTLMAAHLDGIKLAGNEGWSHAIFSLQRWAKPGEAFVGTYAAVCSDDPAHMDALVSEIRARPDVLLRGAISALAWAPWQYAKPAILRWSENGSDPVTIVAALRALYIRNNRLRPDPLCADAENLLQPTVYEFLTHTNTHVRAAACRLSGMEDDDERIKNLLRELLQDADLAVRAQAAIAVARLAQRGAYGSCHKECADQCVEVLLQCVNSQISILSTASGWYAQRANRRLKRWIENLAWMQKPGIVDLLPMLISMPVRSALHFIAHHGDPAYLPFVISQMDNPATARYAGWVWQVITGIDLVKSGLALKETAAPPDSTVRASSVGTDFGLALPNASAIAKYNVLMESGKRYLNGRPITLTQTHDIMEWSSQAERCIAAQHLQTLDPFFIISVRAPSEIQLKCGDEIKEIMRLEGNT